MTTLYLSGPISHSDPAQVERNKQAFRDAAIALRAHGLTVVSPVELCPEVGMPWEWYMKRCLAAMMTCDRLVMLPGWRESLGARLEHDLACGLSMPVRPLAALTQETSP